jgi:iron complex transport system ATP-binding protein
VEKVIRGRGIRFAYNGSGEVLKGIDIDVGEGDFLGILGPNGSGKTTLLRIISGALRPDRGSVLLEGKDLRSIGRRDIARSIAVVHQENDLGFDYTVEEVVSMGRYPHLGRFQFSDPGGEKALEDAMELTQTGSLRKKTITSLSGGERQRVMIARALAQEPRILLLDEPTKNLDVRHSLDLLSLIRKWNIESSLTVVMVLHDLDLAARYCSSLLLIKDGKAAGRGSVDKVMTPRRIEKVFDVRARVQQGERVRIDIIG